MLEDLGVEYVYREYRDDPLTADELRDTLRLLGMAPRDLLRPKESRANGITEELDDDVLIEAMAAEPTLVQRPIAIQDGRALLARPADKLREFLGR